MFLGSMFLASMFGQKVICIMYNMEFFSFIHNLIIANRWWIFKPFLCSFAPLVGRFSLAWGILWHIFTIINQDDKILLVSLTAKVINSSWQLLGFLKLYYFIYWINKRMSRKQLLNPFHFTSFTHWSSILWRTSCYLFFFFFFEQLAKVARKII